LSFTYSGTSPGSSSPTQVPGCWKLVSGKMELTVLMLNGKLQTSISEVLVTAWIGGTSSRDQSNTFEQFSSCLNSTCREVGTEKKLARKKVGTIKCKRLAPCVCCLCVRVCWLYVRVLVVRTSVGCVHVCLLCARVLRCTRVLVACASVGCVRVCLCACVGCVCVCWLCVCWLCARVLAVLRVDCARVF
jgi:hypothetical protein